MAISFKAGAVIEAGSSIDLGNVGSSTVDYLVTRTAWGNNSPQKYSERLYFFELDNISETPTVTTNPSISADPWGGYSDQYGMKVVNWNNKIIVNASSEDINTNNDNMGVVYIYDTSDLSTPETTLHAPYQTANSVFGQDIGVNDTHLFVIEGIPAGRERFFMYDMENLSAGPVEVSVGSLANIPGANTNSAYYGRWGSIGFVDNDHLILVNHQFRGTDVYSNGLLAIVDLSDMSQRFITPNDHDTILSNSQHLSVSNDGSKIYLPSTGAYSDIQGTTSGKLHNGTVSVMDFATGSLLYKIDDPSPDSGTSSTYFGQRFIETNDKLIISAPMKKTSGESDGRIYVYDKSGLSGSSTPSLTLSSPFGITWPTGTHLFGWDMELHNNYLYVADRNEYGQGITFMSSEDKGAYILRYDITDLSASPYQIDEPTIPGISEHVYMFSRQFHIVSLPKLPEFIVPPPPASPYSPVDTGTWTVATSAQFGNSFSGEAFIMREGGNNTTLNTPAEGSMVGSSVALGGNNVFVGNLHHGQENPGRIFVFDKTTGGLIRTLYGPGIKDTNYGMEEVTASSDGSLLATRYYEYVFVQGSATSRYGLGHVRIQNSDGSNVIDIQNPDYQLGNAHANQIGFGNQMGFTSTKLIVGASTADNNGQDSGSVFIYDPTDGNLITRLEGSSNDKFGWGIDTQPNHSRFLVGSSGYNNNAGRVQLFEEDGTEVMSIERPTAGGGGQFGRSVAYGSGRIVVTESLDTSVGRFFIFNEEDGTLIKEVTGPRQDNFATDEVQVAGNYIFVSASGLNSNNGAFWVYDLDGNNGTRVDNIGSSGFAMFGRRLAASVG